MSAPVTILVVHSLLHVRLTWRAMLGLHISRCHIAGEAGTTADMLQAAARLQPDVVLMDAGIAGKGLGATVQQLAACAKNTRLLVCWQYRHERLVQPMPGQPLAYVAEDVASVEMHFAIKELMRNNKYHCRQTERLLKAPAARKPLSAKQLQLLWCMKQRKGAKEMATVTGLEIHTVNSYVKELYALIGSRSMGALESFMKKQGMG